MYLINVEHAGSLINTVLFDDYKSAQRYAIDWANSKRERLCPTELKFGDVLTHVYRLDTRRVDSAHIDTPIETFY